MTPFAQLELREKSAAVQPNPNSGLIDPYAAGGSLHDPYAAYRVPRPGGAPAAAGQAAGKPGQWGVIDNTWGDLAVSSIPFVGSAYLGNKAIQDFRQGNWGSGIGNTIWAALGLIPGVGAIKGGLGAAKAGVKGLDALGKAKNVAGGAWQGAKGAMPGGWKTMVGGSAAAMGAPLLDPSRPQPNAYNTPIYGQQPYSLSDLKRTMVSSVVNNGLPTQ